MFAKIGIVFLSNWACCPISYSLPGRRVTYVISKIRLRTGCTALGPYSRQPNNSPKAHLYSLLSGQQKTPSSAKKSVVTTGVSLSLPRIQAQDAHCCCTPTPRSPLATLPQEGGVSAVSPLPREVLGTEWGGGRHLVNYFIFMRTKPSKIFTCK